MFIQEKELFFLNLRVKVESYCAVWTCCLFDLTGRICLQGRQRKRKSQKKRGCLLPGNLRRNPSEQNSLLMMRELRGTEQREECNFPLLRLLHQTVTHPCVQQSPLPCRDVDAPGHSSPGLLILTPKAVFFCEVFFNYYLYSLSLHSFFHVEGN